MTPRMMNTIAVMAPPLVPHLVQPVSAMEKYPGRQTWHLGPVEPVLHTVVDR